jgi:hypothetical protein
LAEKYFAARMPFCAIHGGVGTSAAAFSEQYSSSPVVDHQLRVTATPSISSVAGDTQDRRSRAGLGSRVDELYCYQQAHLSTPLRSHVSPVVFSFHLGCFTDVNRCSHKVYARPIAIPMSTRLMKNLKLLSMDVSPQRARGP